MPRLSSDGVFYGTILVCALAFFWLGRDFVLPDTPEAKHVSAPQEQRVSAPTSNIPDTGLSQAKTLTAWKCDVTKENYDQLKQGDTFKRVQNLIGCTGVRTFYAESPRQVLATYRWAENEPRAFLSASFKNDALTGKTWIGNGTTEMKHW